MELYLNHTRAWYKNCDSNEGKPNDFFDGYNEDITWDFDSFFYLVSSIVLLKILMSPLIVAMMDFMWVHK